MKSIIQALGAIAFAALAAFPAVADTAYPDKQIRIVVPLAAGGSADAVARMVAEHLRQAWKQNVIVDNKPGASTTIGSAFVAKAPADGYNLLFTPVSIGTIKLYVKNPGFDPAKDLVPITQIARADYVLSTYRDFPAKTLGEFAAYARANPEKVFHGAGAGGQLLVFEQFANQAKFKSSQVNYRGEAPALTALAAGEVQMVVSSVFAARPFIDSGKVRALAVPAPARSAAAPQIPTAAEGGVPNFNIDFWFGLMAPAGTPPEVRKKIGDELASFLAKPETKEKFLALGLEARSSTAAEFGKLIDAETARWVEIAKRAGIEPQ
jgi:tripartite-type tricarboxylate transporter receptor subunit TctC